MPRILLLALALAGVMGGVQDALAAPPPPFVHASFFPVRRLHPRRYDFAIPRSRNAGAMDGRVVSVDYREGIIVVQSPGRGRMEVVILPSTTIQAQQNGFHTIADIAPGARVHVLLSQRGDQFIAQFVNLK